MDPLQDKMWQAILREEIRESIARNQLGPGLVAVGWIHLFAFLGCQAILDPAITSDLRHAGLWILDVLGSLLMLRIICGSGWYRGNGAIALTVRVWATFLILAFSLATLNNLSGWGHDWFKPPWATLSSFGFAMMAWMFDIRFLLLAVQMYVTGILMIVLPHWNYAIFGVSWWLALQILGGFLWKSNFRRKLSG